MSIYIKPSKRGTFTSAAKKHGQSVQGFAHKVKANPENYSPAMRKKAIFAINAKHFKHTGSKKYPDGKDGATYTPFENYSENFKNHKK